MVGQERLFVGSTLSLSVRNPAVRMPASKGWHGLACGAATEDAHRLPDLCPPIDLLLSFQVCWLDCTVLWDMLSVEMSGAAGMLTVPARYCS